MRTVTKKLNVVLTAETLSRALKIVNYDDFACLISSGSEDKRIMGVLGVSSLTLEHFMECNAQMHLIPRRKGASKRGCLRHGAGAGFNAAEQGRPGQGRGGRRDGSQSQGARAGSLSGGGRHRGRARAGGFLEDNHPTRGGSPAVNRVHRGVHAHPLREEQNEKGPPSAHPCVPYYGRFAAQGDSRSGVEPAQRP